MTYARYIDVGENQCSVLFFDDVSADLGLEFCSGRRRVSDTIFYWKNGIFQLPIYSLRGNVKKKLVHLHAF